MTPAMHAVALLWMLAAAPPAEGAPPLALAAHALDRRRDATAVAWDATRGRALLGRDDGVWLVSEAGEPPRALLRRGAVVDLLADPGGALWAATDRGLFARPGGGPWQEQGLPAGAGRTLHRLALGPEGAIAAAGEGGVFVRPSAGRWQRLDGALPAQGATALAFRADGDGLWLAAEGDLYAATLDGLAPRDVRRLPLPGGREPVADLHADRDGVLVLTERRLLHLDSEDRFRVLSLPLPPGARASRITRALGRLWIATDRGVLEEAPDGWRRAPGELASAAVQAVAGHSGGLLTAGERGVHALSAAPEQAAPSRWAAPGSPAVGPAKAAGAPPWAEEPEIGDVRRAALRHLELGPGRTRSLAARARARGWLPDVELRGAYGGGRQRDEEWDQAFTSGEDRLFYDREHRRERGFDVQAVLRWELGDTVYHPEELDVAKEHREVIELRDEVLDELHQLYFERRRVLLALVAHAEPHGLEASRLRLRAAELAAGLDAWTGGWWSAAAPSGASLSSPPEPQEIHP